MPDKLKVWLAFAGVIIATQCIVGAGVLSMLAFLYARQDHDMKLIALTGVVSIASQMMATASTLLVGKALTADSKTTTGLPDPLPSNAGFQQTVTIPPGAPAPA